MPISQIELGKVSCHQIGAVGCCDQFDCHDILLLDFGFGSAFAVRFIFCLFVTARQALRSLHQLVTTLPYPILYEVPMQALITHIGI